MGLLAGPKTRRKLDHDPNNTKWTRNANKFGQKILESQGWQPGEYLGAKDASHAEHLTAASASYIRVSLKDDVKGLGFDRRRENEVTGLDEFSDLLSRLNGKSKASVEKDRQARMEVKMDAYVHSRYGPMRFVRGGLLVGDELKEGSRSDDDDDDDAEGEEDGKEKEKENTTKKRKTFEKKEKEEEEDKKSKKRRKKDKEGKKTKRNKKSKTSEDDDDDDDDDNDDDESDQEGKDEKDENEKDRQEEEETKAERKERKRARKEEKRRRREEKKERRERREGKAQSCSSSTLPSSTLPSLPSPEPATAARPRLNHVRSRFLAAKREAMTNSKALDKIWMVKT
ncbi:Pin2-interacting protein X1 [Geosmithia morbida]|uniref:PinX1-related protein 1 n=1 Tax=Geosmithia morbida TaxID=1094350 RepID=A0A9P5D079_9HYPO|nr:Pin2-interacting protein X1 [Geosmithia morbida]KAF4122448.1 Pin2-interacting protein X1 [Geosmithia morbida]